VSIIPRLKPLWPQCTADGIERLARCLLSDNNFEGDRATQLILLRLTL
jgi:hypothetical protein